MENKKALKKLKEIEEDFNDKISKLALELSSNEKLSFLELVDKYQPLYYTSPKAEIIATMDGDADNSLTLKKAKQDRARKYIQILAKELKVDIDEEEFDVCGNEYEFFCCHVKEVRWLTNRFYDGNILIKEGGCEKIWNYSEESKRMVKDYLMME